MSKSDEFELSSGLPWADTVVTITAAAFGYNPNIGGGTAVCANLTGINEDGDESEQSFSVGDHWEIVDSGARIQSDSGVENKKISKNSNYGKLIADALRSLEDPSIEDARERRQAAAEAMPFESAKEISGWVGTRWRTETEQVPRVDYGTGKQRLNPDGTPQMRDAIRFVGYEGRVDGDTAPSAKAAPAKASKPAISDDDPLVQQLLELAREADDFDAFTEAALDTPGVEDNAKLVSRVMSAKADGIWKTAGR